MDGSTAMTLQAGPENTVASPKSAMDEAYNFLANATQQLDIDLSHLEEKLKPLRMEIPVGVEGVDPNKDQGRPKSSMSEFIHCQALSVSNTNRRIRELIESLDVLS